MSARTGHITTCVLRDEGFAPIGDNLKLPDGIPDEYSTILKLSTSHVPTVIELMHAIVSVCVPAVGNIITQRELHRRLTMAGHTTGDHFGRNLQKALVQEAYQPGKRGPNGGGEIIGLGQRYSRY